MNWLRQILAALHRWFTGRAPALRVVRLEELPEQLDPRYVYLIGEGGYCWFAALLCPCGCGDVIQLSTMPEGRPRWMVREHPDATVSLEPSIWRTVGCRSHFFVRRGRIVGCEPRPPHASEPGVTGGVKAT